MTWVIGILVVAVVIFVISGAAEKQKEVQKKEEFNQLASSKTLAYVDYLRRTSSRDEIQQMSDNELRDFVLTNIRQYKADVDDLNNKMAGIIVLCFIVGVVVANLTAEFNWFFILVWLVIGGAGAYKFQNSENPKIASKYESMGLDIERLKVSQE